MQWKIQCYRQSTRCKWRRFNKLYWDYTKNEEILITMYIMYFLYLCLYNSTKRETQTFLYLSLLILSKCHTWGKTLASLKQTQYCIYSKHPILWFLMSYIGIKSNIRKITTRLTIYLWSFFFHLSPGINSLNGPKNWN